MELTPTQKTQLDKDFSSYAKEDVACMTIGGTLYVFGSELACLRLFHKYRNTSSARVEYSENMKSWFYAHDIESQ